MTSNRWLLSGCIAALLSIGVVAGRTLFAPTPADSAALTAFVERAKPPGDSNDSALGTVVMDATRIEIAGIGLLSVETGNVQQEIVAQASVGPSPSGAAILAARVAGAVTEIRTHLGDTVKSGEVLALIESPEAATITADGDSALARAIAARAVNERERRLFEAKVTARQDYEAAQAELATAEAELRRTAAAAVAARVTSDGRHVAVTSPMTGRVTAATATLGAYVTSGTELFRVADPSRIQIEAALPTADALRVAPGDPAFLVDAEGTRISVKVNSITPGLNTESRSATAVLAVIGDARSLQSGQLVRVIISPSSSQSAPNVLVIPQAAVQSVKGHDVVFVRTRQGFTATPVRLGERGEGRVEILEGIVQGQTIAAKNAFLLKAELGKRAEEGE